VYIIARLKASWTGLICCTPQHISTISDCFSHSSSVPESIQWNGASTCTLCFKRNVTFLLLR